MTVSVPLSSRLSASVLFSDVDWAAVPDAAGAYVIYDGDEVLYVGMAGGDSATRRVCYGVYYTKSANIRGYKKRRPPRWGKGWPSRPVRPPHPAPCRMMFIMVFHRTGADYLRGLTFPIAFPYVEWYTPMHIP